MVPVSTLWPSALYKRWTLPGVKLALKLGNARTMSQSERAYWERSCGWGKQRDFTSVHNMKNAVLNFGFYCSKAYNLKLAVILWKDCGPARLWHGRKGRTIFSSQSIAGKFSFGGSLPKGKLWVFCSSEDKCPDGRQGDSGVKRKQRKKDWSYGNGQSRGKRNKIYRWFGKQRRMTREKQEMKCESLGKLKAW